MFVTPATLTTAVSPTLAPYQNRKTGRLSAQHAQKEDSKDDSSQKTVGPAGGSRQLPQPIGEQRDAGGHSPPTQRHPASSPQVVVLTSVRPQESFVKIDHRHRGQRVQSPAHGRHGGGKDGGNDQSAQSGRQFVNGEVGENRILWDSLCLVRMLEIVDRQQQTGEFQGE